MGLKTILDGTPFAKNVRGPPWETQMLLAMKQAVEQEREECAELAMTYAKAYGPEHDTHNIANAIRARGNEPTI